MTKPAKEDSETMPDAVWISPESLHEEGHMTAWNRTLYGNQHKYHHDRKYKALEAERDYQVRNNDAIKKLHSKERDMLLDDASKATSERDSALEVLGVTKDAMNLMRVFITYHIRDGACVVINDDIFSVADCGEKYVKALTKINKILEQKGAENAK